MSIRTRGLPVCLQVLERSLNAYPLLNHHLHGNGERTVILLHGLFGLSANLGPLARELARDYRVILPDLRNHGDSFHDERMTYPLMADDVRRLMDAFGVERASLVGHSMGGKVAMQLALSAGDRVDTLIVADIAPVDYQPHHDGVFTALVEAGRDPLADRRMTQRILQSHIRDPAVIAFLLMNRRRREDGTWFWRFNLDALLANYSAILRAPEMGQAFGGTTLFIKGELSDYVTGDHRDETRRMFPAARLKVMAGTGHWLHAEKPSVFLRLVRDALRRD